MQPWGNVFVAYAGHGQNETALPDRVAQQVAHSTPATARYSPNPIDLWGIAPRDLPPFTFMMIRAMLWEPTIRLGLAMRAAPIQGLEWAYQDGQDWIPGVRCKDPEVAAWILKQLRAIWMRDLPRMMLDQVWGWCGGEIVWGLNESGKLDVKSILTRHASDVRALEQNGQVVGVRFRRVPQTSVGHIDLPLGKAYWHPFMPEDGSHYGYGILRGAYSPWADKWLDGGGLDVRRLFMHKDAYGGATVGYPPGMMEIAQPDGTVLSVPNRDIARQMAEQIKAGGVVVMPNQYDQNGKPMWTLERAVVASNPGHILAYPKDSDVEMLRGIEIPDDVLTSEATGAWAGKAVPMQAFYSGLTRWGTSIVGAVQRSAIETGIMLNWGKAHEFEISFKPLALQAMEQANAGQKQDQGGDGGSHYPAQQRIGYSEGDGESDAVAMSLRREQVAAALVGEGIVGAAKLVEAVRGEMGQRLRMAQARAPHNMTIAGKEYKGGQFIPGEELAKATDDQKAEIEAAAGDAKPKRASGFASPNTEENLSFDQALDNMDSPKHRQAKRQFDTIDHDLGLSFASFSVVGDWGDGAEDSVVTNYVGGDYEDIRYAMAWKGLLADQKAVLLFEEKKGEKGSVYLFQPNDTINGVRETLTKHGIDSRSIGVGVSGKPQVLVVDLDDILADSIDKVTEHYGIKSERIAGRGEFIGVGFDQSRDDAKREYRRVIDDYEKAFPDRRHFRPSDEKSTQLGRRTDARRTFNRPLIAIISPNRQRGGNG